MPELKSTCLPMPYLGVDLGLLRSHSFIPLVSDPSVVRRVLSIGGRGKGNRYYFLSTCVPGYLSVYLIKKVISKRLRQTGRKESKPGI